MHQGSAIESMHHDIANIIQEAGHVNSAHHSATVPNDGTNACAFLVLKFLDEIQTNLEENKFEEDLGLSKK